MRLSGVSLLELLLASLCLQVVLSDPSLLYQQKQRENISLFSVTSASSVLTTANPPWSPELFPNPYTHPLRCNRPRPSFVCDPDKIITVEEGKP